MKSGDVYYEAWRTYRGSAALGGNNGEDLRVYAVAGYERVRAAVNVDGISVWFGYAPAPSEWLEAQ